jgi:hypothetical protein
MRVFRKRFGFDVCFWIPNDVVWTSLLLYGLDDWDLYSGKGRIFLFASRLKQAVGPTQSPIWYLRGALTGKYSGRNMKLSICFCREPRSRMRGGLPRLPYTPSWCDQDWLPEEDGCVSLSRSIWLFGCVQWVLEAHSLGVIQLVLRGADYSLPSSVDV